MSAAAVVLAGWSSLAPASADPADQQRLIVWQQVPPDANLAPEALATPIETLPASAQAASAATPRPAMASAPASTSTATPTPSPQSRPTPTPTQLPTPSPTVVRAGAAVYPLSDTVQVRRRGNTTVTTRLLKTTRAPDGREAAVDRVIVSFNPGATPVHVQNAVPVLRLGPNTQLVDVSRSGGLNSALNAYRSLTGVRYVQPDYVYRASEVPNDPLFSQQWGMSLIKAPTAWDYTHGSGNVLIAIVDTGIYDEQSTYPSPDGGPGHPDLRGKVALDTNFSDEAGTDDNFGHGTHVAGIAAANTSNGIGVAGAGYATRLLNVKVLDSSGSGTESAVDSGIRWAADHNAKVINLSLGAPGACTPTAQDAIDYAWSQGAVIVVAAGNDGTTNLETPASCNHVIAVASVDSNDTMSSFSTSGTWVQVAAPGGADQSGNGILSTSNTGGYVQMQGTSMATPHVSGLAALLWATAFGTSNASVVQRIESSADPIPGTGTSWAFGRINAAMAVCPPVSVTAVPAGTGRLQVTVSVPGLVSVQFGNPSSNPSSPSNALIDIGSLSGQTGNFTVTYPSGTSGTTFYVRRMSPGVTTTVPIIVHDSCQAWPSVVGGGPSAF